MSRVIPHSNVQWAGYLAQYVGQSGTQGSSPQNTNNALTSSDSDTYMTFAPAYSGTTNLIYAFNITGIPISATINSISCKVKIRCSNTGSFQSAVVQLYSGDTAKGTAIDFTNNTSTTVRTFSDCGTWTPSDFENDQTAVLQVSELHVYSGSYTTTGLMNQTEITLPSYVGFYNGNASPSYQLVSGYSPSTTETSSEGRVQFQTSSSYTGGTITILMKIKINFS